jgi:hypothetical protein
LLSLAFRDYSFSGYNPDSEGLSVKLSVLVLGMSCLPAFAQGPALAAVRPVYQSAKANMIEAAEAMPDADYMFKLSPAQRAFGDWIEHTAGMNIRMCAAMVGDSPQQPDFKDKSKGALVDALKASFALCDATYSRVTEESVLKEVPPGGKPITPLSIMVQQIAQLSSHYGNLVGYLRAKGVTPPSTARSAKK